jgi:Asp-tRNA(Asn)/Glu-tRNA(Gln) amidotransferase A subunit family amidase
MVPLNLRHTGWWPGATSWRIRAVIGELADAVRSKRVAARELVERALERIDEHDGALNAVVRVAGDEAVERAAALDERVARGDDVGRLAGVPFLVKDIEDLAGSPTTFGSLLFADAPAAERDGLVPGRLRAAGAIPVGKTNTPEFAVEGFTSNLLWGTTRNPWSLDWSPGGSSGGSGAAVAAGLAPIATATDGGGSIRIPAAFCGLVGIKPTNGVVGRSPIPSWIDLSTDGPFATTVEDLRLLLEVEAGPAAGDPSALPAWPSPRAGDRRPSRAFAAPRFTPWGPLPGEIGRLFDTAIRTLEGALGVAVEPLEPESLFATGNPDTDWFVLCSVEHLSQLGRAFVERGIERMHPAVRAFFEVGLATSLDEYLSARRRRFEYVRELDELLGDDAVIATPTLAATGWLAEGWMPGPERTGVPAEVYNTAVQNITGSPAISMPAGVCSNGVPFGLQITGPRFRDDLLLDVAGAWERANPRPLAAPGYEPFDAGID